MDTQVDGGKAQEQMVVLNLPGNQNRVFLLQVYKLTLKKWILAMYWWVREYPVTDMMLDGQLSMFEFMSREKC